MWMQDVFFSYSGNNIEFNNSIPMVTSRLYHFIISCSEYFKATQTSSLEIESSGILKNAIAKYDAVLILGKLHN